MLIYIRGDPGAGKITVGRMLSERLKWPLFWFHEVYQEAATNPELIDRLVEPRLRELLQKSDNAIYVRPSRLAASVAKVRAIADECSVDMEVVCLIAGKQQLIERVEGREPYANRIKNRAELKTYLQGRPLEHVYGELPIDTSLLTPDEVCRAIRELI
jgi:cytidylate kinase